METDNVSFGPILPDEGENKMRQFLFLFLYCRGFSTFIASKPTSLKDQLASVLDKLRNDNCFSLLPPTPTRPKSISGFVMVTSGPVHCAVKRANIPLGGPCATRHGKFNE